MPTTTSVVSTHPLFLAYTQGGPGHYDAVIMVDTGNPPENVIVDESPISKEKHVYQSGANALVHNWAVQISVNAKILMEYNLHRYHVEACIIRQTTTTTTGQNH